MAAPGWTAPGCSQAGWGSARRRKLSRRNPSHCMAHVCSLPCAAWVEPLWAASTASWGAFGGAWWCAEWCAAQCCLLVYVIQLLVPMAQYFFLFFWSGPSFSSLLSVRQLYSFHKSHYNWCQATAWPCSSCTDLQARESRDGDFTPVQGVHPGKHQVYNLLSCIFSKLRSRTWITNRRDIRRALSKLTY